MIDLSNLSGPTHVRVLLDALCGAGLLGRFFTGLAWNDDTLAARLTPPPLRRELARRRFDAPPLSRICRHPLDELTRVALSRAPFASWRRLGVRLFPSTGCLRHDRFVARRLADHEAVALYAYQGMALESLREARRLERFRFYDIVSNDWRWNRKIRDDEVQGNPQWAASWSSNVDVRRLDEERACADRLLVPSALTEKTLLESRSSVDFDEKRLTVIPYGVPPPRIGGEERRRVLEGRHFPPCDAAPLKALFIGRLSQEKGLSYLFEAMDSCRGAVSLTLVGARPAAACPPLDRRLGEHVWFSSLDRRRLDALIADHDVLVLPSLSDAYATVVGEAMAHGLPAIVSAHVGAAQLIEDGVNGFIVPIRDSDAIAARLTELAESRDRLIAMSLAARESCEKHGWARYAEAALSRLRDDLKARLP